MPHIHPLRSPHRVGMRSSGVAGVVASRPVELSACEAEAFRERSGRIVLQPSTVMAELSASEAEA